MTTVNQCLLFLLLAASLILATPVRVGVHSKTKAIRGRYIVTLKSDIGPDAVKNHLAWVASAHSQNVNTLGFEGNVSCGIEKVYSIESFRGYSGSFNMSIVEKLKNSNDVSINL